MPLKIDIDATKEELEKIAKEVEEIIRQKYGDRIKQVRLYGESKNIENVAEGIRYFVQGVLLFMDENDPEYPFMKGLESGLKEYIKVSREQRG